MNHLHSVARRTNFVVALVLAMMLSLAPHPDSANSGPEGSLDRWAGPMSGPVVYSQGRYSLFFGTQQEVIGRQQHFTGASASPYQPIDGSSPRMLRYRGAGKQR